MTSQALEPVSGDVIPYPTAPTTLFQNPEPSAIVRQAAGIANELKKVIAEQKLFTTINGRDHVRVEGWCLLGTMLGVFPVPLDPEPLADGKGWKARVEARTMSGALVGAATAICTRDEPTWKGRPEYALCSMAQTRATGKALRLPLGFVMTLAGYDATPAEEMDGVQAVVDTRERARQAASRPSPRPQTAPTSTPGQGTAPTRPVQREPIDGQSALAAPDDLPFDTEPMVDDATLYRLRDAGAALKEPLDKEAIIAFVKNQHNLDSPKMLTQAQAEAIIARWDASA